jgi:hypothetical protein
VAHVTIGFGLVLIVLGLGGYLGTGRVSKTALIPTAFGVPILALGLLALREDWRTGALYGAVALAAVGFVGSARGLPGVWRLLAGGTVPRPAAAVAQSVMAILCAAYIALALWSLLAAP